MAPLSGKQRKAQLKLKRAVKRGDVPDPPEQPQRRKKKAPESRSLQSQFIKLDKSFLDDTRVLAGSLVLRRPIPADVAVLRHEWIIPSQLTVPKRPRWKYQMSKEELDANEQAYFRTWLAQQDATIDQWTHALNDRDQPDRVEDSETHPMPHPPTHFERNIEVWRQFWRVTEISQILLVLLDSRCPPLHLPSALSAYLNIPTSASLDDTNLSPKRSKSKSPRVILVLTKLDIPGPARTASWTSFLNANYPGIPVVPVEAYASKSSPSVEQGSTRYEPHLPGTFRERLVHTLRDVHNQLLQPPQWVTTPRPDETEEARLQRIAQWKPRVKRIIDWENVLKAKGKLVGKTIGGSATPRGRESERETERTEGDDVEVSDDEEERTGNAYEWKEPEFLTVGVVGQPNVGKSSLLNAIFGKTRVRASRTPGKTKHFQTLFWTADVRLVDCPGLVMPSFVPMDIQVLSGVLPISRIAAVPFCVHQLARLFPLEEILELAHPSLSRTNTSSPVASITDRSSISLPGKSKPASADLPLVEDKRTWRPGQHPLERTKVQTKASTWTANDIMTAYAEKKGWVTAKAGRPDIHRAGNAILRLIAEGKIPWAFWPPSSIVSGKDGVWLKDGVQQHALDEVDSAEQDSERDSEVEEISSEEEVISDEDEEKPAVRGGSLGRFGALEVE